METILEEAETLAKAGVRELILIAQDLTEYGRDLYGKLCLPDLLRKLCRIGGDDLNKGFRWIRLIPCGFAVFSGRMRWMSPTWCTRVPARAYSQSAARR